MPHVNIQKILTIGQRLHITWGNRVYSSLLLDVSDEHLDIGVIQRLGREVSLEPDEVLTVGFGLPDSGYYRFNTVVIGMIFEPGPAVRLAIPEQVERVQQRRHYRLPINIPFSFRVINDLRSHRSFITHGGRTVDLSGGGMQFVCQEKLEFGDRLEIDITQNLILPYGMIGNVLRLVENADGFFQASLQFLNLERQQEEVIIRFIFQEQVRRRRLEL